MSKKAINWTIQKLQAIWKNISYIKDDSVRTMLLFGFSSGLPSALIFGTLSSWLNEAGIKKSTITLFSWAALGYGFKFVWAPLIDQGKLPLLYNKFGKRRSWLLILQILLAITIGLMAFVNPNTKEALYIMAILAVMLGFLSASQDIVIDAYRIEASPPELLGVSSAAYQLGYRLAMIISGLGALTLSQALGSELSHYSYEAWKTTYLLMSQLMIIGIVTTLFIKEPYRVTPPQNSKGSKQLLTLFVFLVITFIVVHVTWNAIVHHWLNALAPSSLIAFFSPILRLITAFFMCFIVAKFLIQKRIIPVGIAKTAYLAPIQEFISRYPKKTVWLLLLLIGFYRVSDIVLGINANLFYQDIGFSKAEFATASKFFGIFMTLYGVFIGGLLVANIGTMRTMYWGAVSAAGTNLLFMLLAWFGNKLWLLYIVIGADNLAAGIATTAFITFLSRLSNIKFTAMQYAIFSSMMILLPKMIGGYSGTIVSSSSYTIFFLITTLLGLPIILLVNLVAKQLTLEEDKR